MIINPTNYTMQNSYPYVNPNKPTSKPSAERYNTIIKLTILLIIILACYHLVKNGFHLEMHTVPKTPDVTIKDAIPQEIVQNSINKSQEAFKNINTTNSSIMDDVYYYGKIIVVVAVGIGILYAIYKSDVIWNYLSPEVTQKTGTGTPGTGNPPAGKGFSDSHSAPTGTGFNPPSGPLLVPMRVEGFQEVVTAADLANI